MYQSWRYVQCACPNFRRRLSEISWPTFVEFSREQRTKFGEFCFHYFCTVQCKPCCSKLITEPLYKLGISDVFGRLCLFFTMVVYVSYPYRKALKVKIQNKVALRQVVRKQDGFQDRKNENTPNFPSIEYDIKQHSDAT